MHHLILVVEDDPLTREVVASALAREGFSVKTASNGKQALSSLQRISPDLIILDLGLPDLSGKDLLQVIKQNPQRQDIPLLVLTANRQPNQECQLLLSGADDYMTKPFQPRILLARIQALIRRSGQRDKHSDRLDIQDLSLNARNRTAFFREAPLPALAPKEFEILFLLGSEFPNAVSRKTISGKVWGKALDEIHERSIDVHVHKLRQHLQPHPSIRIETLSGKGYRLIFC